MTEPLLGLSIIIILGIFAQWIAWRSGVPSILLLLISGFIAGPITGFIDPDAIFGKSLFPLVSLSVALILFEGGLNLKVFELRETGGVVYKLISVGALVTWFLAGLAAHIILELDLPISVLLGAILVVTGPTVIIPLLRQIRPVGKVGSILRWEGILIDPVGAVIAVLVYEAISAGLFDAVPKVVLAGIYRTILAGSITGALGALVLIVLLRFYLVPDFLQSSIALMTVIVVFTLSNMSQPESGLLAVTVMGVVLANQKSVPMRGIMDFKENLRVILLALLFIMLAARVELKDFEYIGVRSVVFLAFIIFVARPAAVFVSTFASSLDWRERLALSFVAPRGIVAAAVSSVFALKLSEAGYQDAAELAPITFLVITGTVIIYGLGAPVLIRRLNLSVPNPQGVFMVGAYPWTIALACAIRDEGFKVLMADTNWDNILKARMAGLPTYYGSVLSESALQEIDLGGIGRLMALTPNYGVNSLSVLHFKKVLESAEQYQLVPEGDLKSRNKVVSEHLHGRFLFGKNITFSLLEQKFKQGAVIKKTRLTDMFDYDAFLKLNGEKALPLMLITEKKSLVVLTADNAPAPLAGQTLLSLVSP